jgi:hypothetical protein
VDEADREHEQHQRRRAGAHEHAAAVHDQAARMHQHAAVMMLATKLAMGNGLFRLGWPHFLATGDIATGK